MLAMLLMLSVSPIRAEPDSTGQIIPVTTPTPSAMVPLDLQRYVAHVDESVYVARAYADKKTNTPASKKWKKAFLKSMKSMSGWMCPEGYIYSERKSGVGLSVDNQFIKLLASILTGGVTALPTIIGAFQTTTGDEKLNILKEEILSGENQYWKIGVLDQTDPEVLKFTMCMLYRKKTCGLLRVLGFGVGGENARIRGYIYNFQMNVKNREEYIDAERQTKELYDTIVKKKRSEVIAKLKVK